jgi:hypothetical protein
MQGFTCYNSGCYTLASHNRGLGSILGEFICSVDEPSAALSPRTHWIQGRVNPSNSLDAAGKINFLPLLGLESWPFNRPVHSLSL